MVLRMVELGCHALRKEIRPPAMNWIRICWRKHRPRRFQVLVHISEAKLLSLSPPGPHVLMIFQTGAPHPRPETRNGETGTARERQREIEEDVLPFGIINSYNDEEEESFVDVEGDVWTTDSRFPNKFW